MDGSIFSIKAIYYIHKYVKSDALSTSLVYILKLSQLLIEYSIRFKIVFVLVFYFNVYIDDDESTKEVKQILF